MSHELLDLRKAFAFQFSLEEFAAAFTELTYGGQQSIYLLFLIELRRRVIAGIREREVLNRFLIILRPA